MNKIVPKLPHAARIFLGLVFFVFGLNGFLQFIPLPPLPDKAGAFMGALAATGYFFPLLKTTEIVAGLALLSNRFVPLALVLLAPIVVHIAAFHAALTPGEIGMSVVLVGLMGFLGWAYRGAFAGLLSVRSTPSVDRASAPHGERKAALQSA